MATRNNRLFMVGLILILLFFSNICINLNSEAISSQALFDNSLKAFYDKKLERAAEGFEEVVKSGKEPWSKRSIFMLGRTYLELGKHEEARDLFLRAISEYDELADYSLYYLSESFLREKDFEKASDILRLLYKTYTGSPLKALAQFKEAESLFLLGKFKEAISTFDNFLAENPDDPMIPEAKLYKGRALKQLDMIAEAGHIFKGIWLNYPDSTNADKAREELVMLRLNAEDYRIRAENLFKISLYSKALIDLQKAIDIEREPRNVNRIRFLIGIALFKLKRYEETIGVFNKILDQEEGLKEGTREEVLYYLATAYLRRGNKDKFFETSDKLYRHFPQYKKTPEILLSVADEFRRSGEREKALNIYDLIIKEYPEAVADAFFQRGWMKYLSRDFEKSSRDMRELIERYPDSPRVPQALYWKARCYDKSGNSSKAEELYRRIAKEYPSTFYGYLAVERLKRVDIDAPLSESPKSMKIVKAYQPGLSSRFQSALSLPDSSFPKIRELKILGMREEAIEELNFLRDRNAHKEDIENLIKIGDAYIDLLEYRMAISMVEGSSKKDKRLAYLSYPLGFWLFLDESSRETVTDPYLLAALIREESRFDPKAISRAGAKGLMQIVPATWDWVSRQKQKTDYRLQTSDHRNSDPFDPEENIRRGSWYLRYLLDKYSQNLILALSAYNAGPEVVNLWIKNGPEEPDEFVEEIPYRETRGYVKRVLRSYEVYKKIYNIPDRCL